MTSGAAATEEEKRQREIARNKLADYRRKLKCLGDNVILRSTYQREIMELEAFLGGDADEMPSENVAMSKSDMAAKATASARSKSIVSDPSAWIRMGNPAYLTSVQHQSMDVFV